ncbi:Diacylglycerol kinase [Meloidogyne graminicola]|uniref:Diacylglycerol kinase n=1 Tax=Meloidogyne graminicola TaxID=189291 RepID=A0A8T0A3X8_9BILA|nr:Diacylglycerol kinase [Meloidogyne graminicola]
MLQAFGKIRKMKWTLDEKTSINNSIQNTKEEISEEEEENQEIIFNKNRDCKELNNILLKNDLQTSPITSPGCSSINSTHSFHLNFPSKISNLRKSGINLVKNIPNNIRKSSIAMFQVNTINNTSFENNNNLQKQLNKQNSINNNEKSLNIQQNKEIEGGMNILINRKKSFNNNYGSAKRAMRKRILSAKCALKRLSNNNNNSLIQSFNNNNNIATSSILLCHHSPSIILLEKEKKIDESQFKHILKANEEDEIFVNDNNIVVVKEKKIKKENEEEEEYGKEIKIKKKRSWAASFVQKKSIITTNIIEIKAQQLFLDKLNKKKPLRPSLSWDPQKKKKGKEKQRSVISSPGSQTSRSRIHSDGSTTTKKPSILNRDNYLWPFSLVKSQNSILESKKENKKFNQFHIKKKISTATLVGKKRKKNSNTAIALYKKGNRSNSLSALSIDLLPKEEDNYFNKLTAEYRTSGLRTEIECAVKRLAAKLTSSGSPARTRRIFALSEQKEKKNLKENEKQMEMLRRTPESADEGFWNNYSPQNVENNGNENWNELSITSGIPSSLPSTNSPQHSTTKERELKKLKNENNNIQMDTLKPPGFSFGISSSLLLPSNSSFSSSPSYSSSSSSFSPCFSGYSSIDNYNGGLLLNNYCLSLHVVILRDIELWSVSSLSSAEVSSNATGDRTAGISTPGSDSIRTVRSRSFDPSGSPDCVLRRPSRIEHLSDIFRKALAKSPVVKRAAALQEQEQKRATKHRTSRYWLEEQINPSEHIWLPSCSISSSTTVDTECYLGETDCGRIGEKRRCAACHIVAHTECFPLLAKMNLNCKSTYRDCINNRRQNCRKGQDVIYKHHWVHRWKLEGRCFHCGKSFQQKMFREKEVIAINCSWCKRSYHNKRSCFSLARFDDRCDRGILRELILPPNWLLRLSNQRNKNKLTIQQQQTLTTTTINNSLKRNRKKYRPFIVKFNEQTQNNVVVSSLINSKELNTNVCQQPPIQPLLAFVNPKSGGNKGSKALNSLCWLLNPRQVFDINTMHGPKYGLEIFRKMTNQMRILVCGGDGTVGWLLSTLDQLNWNNYPPIAILPLGTGNDLSRSMGWGGTFSDEPLTEILQAIQTETSITFLDRWRLDVFPLFSINNQEQQQQQLNNNNNLFCSSEQQFNNNNNENKEHNNTINNECQNNLPLSVMNNYFSIGADAHVALQFHHSRSANPQMLNSRLKNRLAYGGLGTIDLFKRAWKDLSEYITVECDGVDISPKIKEFKFHCVLFHNISFYAGGTIPWGQGGDGVQECCGEVFSRPSPCDGKIEVLGFTTATLATLQMGGRGERIAQCSNVRIETSKPIPMQVDGEPCLLGPSLIHLSFHNKVPMLKREKFARLSGSAPTNNIISMNANRRRKNSNQNNNNSNIINIQNNNQINEQNNGLKTTTISSPINQQQHKISKASLSSYQFPPPSSPPNNINNISVCIPIVVVGRHDYDTFRDSVDRLKDTGFELGTLILEAELELNQVRERIQKMLSEHQILPYEPGNDWRFLDYVSSPEEGTFRISQQQEYCKTVADVSSLDETNSAIIILDDAFPSMTVRSAAIGHDLVFNPAGVKQIKTLNEKNNLMRRRIGETLRIIPKKLTSKLNDAQLKLIKFLFFFFFQFLAPKKFFLSLFYVNNNYILYENFQNEIFHLINVMEIIQ